MHWPLFILIAYLVGAIPFGLLIGKAKSIDIREHGSKNIGATNVGRVLGREWGWFCFALDMLKGAGPVLAAGAVMGTLHQRPEALTQAEMWWWLAVASATILGHMFPIYIRFKGGKGVATASGALVAMWPVLTIPVFIGLVVWYTTLRLTKYVSVASMTAAAAIPLVYLLTIIPSDLQDTTQRIIHASPPLIVTALLAALVIYKHRGNIARLRRGEEPKVGGAARRGDVMKGGERQ